MKKERKELLKNFKVIVEDLLDNYEKYTEEEKAQVKAVFEKVAELNKVLDKYDVDTSTNWNEYLEMCSRYFDAFRY